MKLFLDTADIEQIREAISWGIVDGVDTPAVFRPSDTTFYFRHTLTEGVADSQFQFGESPWLPVAGAFGLG